MLHNFFTIGMKKIYVKYSYKKAYRVVFQTEDAKQYFGKS